MNSWESQYTNNSVILRNKRPGNLFTRTSENNWQNESRPGQESGLKSITTSPVQKMDSIVDYIYDTVSMGWLKEAVEAYKYDLKGRMSSGIFAFYDLQTQIRMPADRIEYTYNSENMVLSELSNTWVDSLGLWVKNYRTDRTYNLPGLESARVSSEWDPMAMSWRPAFLDSSIYDINENLTYQVSYLYDTVLMDWKSSFREVFFYDTNDFQTRSTSFFWNIDSSDWMENNQTIFWPDENGNDTLTWDYYWDGFSWIETSRTIFAYNANGDITNEEYYNFDGEVWYGNYKEESVYDGMMRLASSVEYIWDWNTGDWILSGDVQLARDGNGNIVVETYQDYDTGSQTFIYTGRTWWEFDNSILWADIAVPFGITGEGGADGIVNKVLSSSEADWDTAMMSFDTIFKSLVYYSDFVTAINTDTVCRADYTWGVDTVNDMLVHFTDQSDSTVISWYWIFGDGESSTLQNPDHLFSRAGSYRVILTTLDESGSCNNTFSSQVTVGNPECKASFNVLVDTSSRTVTLENLSEGISPDYYWDFGDGSFSTQSDPVHQYNFPGTYEITFTVRSVSQVACMDRSSTQIKVGSSNCNPDFAVFVDSSTNTAYFRAKELVDGNRYYWLFGDGSIAAKPNAVRTFPNPGYYSAVLTVSNSVEGCVQSKRESILVGSKSPGGKAGFIHLSDANNTVNFTDQSLGTGLSYLWNFNDGDTSSLASPEHTYTESGYYYVCLTVTSAEGLQNTHCEKIFAGGDTQDECLAQFSYTVADSILEIACQDRSFGNPDAWKWSYSDGWSSTKPNPVYSVGEAGYYTVRLNVKNSTTGCSDDAFGLINLASEAGLKAGFGFTIDSSDLKAESYPVDFVGVSLGDAGKMQWSFGDGTLDSTTINPTHVYSNPGTYEVCLTITNTATGEVDITCDSITVNAAPTSVIELNPDRVNLMAYPNPFSETCRIVIGLEDNSRAKLTLYDLMGRKVSLLLDEELPAGDFNMEWNGSNMVAGNYYLILETERGIARQMLSILR
jgi:PKD repeat protein